MQGYFEWPLDHYIVSYGDNHINVHSRYTNENYFYRDDTIRPDHLKEDVFRSAAEMFDMRRNSSRSPNEYFDAFTFFQEAAKHSKELGLPEGMIKDVKKEADADKIMEEFNNVTLDQILAKLRAMGFKVDRDGAKFKFYFVNRKTPFEINIQSQRIHNGEPLIDTFDVDELLDAVEEKLRPEEGRKYMPSFLKTWEEFKAIRYRQPRVEVETQPWEAFKNAKQII